MAKHYADELAEWVRERPAARPRQDRSTVAFLAVRDDVKAALAAGFSMKTIWAHLQATGRIASRYETFTLHVKRHIRTPPPAHPPAPTPLDAPPAPQPTQAAAPKPVPDESRKTPPSVGGFTFNATPKTEDLF